MVADVVVTLVNTTSVRSCSQCIRYAFDVQDAIDQVPCPRRLLAVEIQARGRIGASILQFAIPASLRILGLRWLLVSPEVLQASEGTHSNALDLAHPRGNQVHVVATLGKDGVGALCLVAPTAADEGVREMVMPDWLNVVDRQHLADGTTLDQLLDLGIRKVVPEHVAHRANRPANLASCDDLFALLLRDGHRLLQQEALEVRACGDGRLHVHPVRSGDDADIRLECRAGP
mmetsp:Transcript_71546/g.205265  ORF Transcript_71546/g.205265 Transcript_71546/m.205265 type:complete len:231 (-) Transcript_71546:499-1191(-)